MVPTHTAPTAAPGWYRDPAGAEGWRWWTGTEFSSYVHRPAKAAAVPLGAALRLCLLAVAALTALKLVPLPERGWGVVASFVSAPAFYAALAISCVVVARRAGGMGAIGWELRPADLAVGPAAYLASVAAAATLGAMLLLARVPSASNNPFVGDGTDGFISSLNIPVLLYMFVLVVVVAPVVEEMLLRGVLLRALAAHIHPAAAVAAQAAMFGVMHADLSFGTGNLGLVLILSSTGAVLGGAAQLSGRIGGAIVAHMLFNGISFAVGAGLVFG